MTKNLKAFIEIFDCDKKSELKKLCKSEQLFGSGFINLILAAESSAFPYRHEIHHREYVPEVLNLTDEDLKTIGTAKVGKMEKDVAKAFNKITQTFKQRTILIGHLFYTPCHTRWHLIYFDQRDTQKHGNHWKEGSHAHIINHLWPNWTAQSIWEQFTKGTDKLNASLHFKFSHRDYAEKP